MVSGRLIVTGFVLLIVAVVGLVVTRWTHRRFAVAPRRHRRRARRRRPPDRRPVAADGPAARRRRRPAPRWPCARRTRAVPMLVLGLALGAGALVDALGTAAPVAAGCRGGRSSPAVVVLLAIANLPSLTGHRLVDPAIDRDEHPPAAWQDATAALDAGDTGGRVLQLPGQEFGAFRWGYTVDPPLPGMTDQAARHPRPPAARQRAGDGPAVRARRPLPDRHRRRRRRSPRWPACSVPTRSGSPATPRSTASAPPRPELVADLFADGVPGTGAGDAVRRRRCVNVPDIPMVDEQSVVRPPRRPADRARRAGARRPTPCRSSGSRTTSCSSPAAATGSSTPPAAGLLDGRELVRYTGSLHGRRADGRRRDRPAEIIVTDSNRDRAHQWRSSQDVIGFTEDDDPTHARPAARGPGRPAPAGVRRRPTPRRRSPCRTARCGARASAYGEPFAYRPEDRAVMADRRRSDDGLAGRRPVRPDRRADPARRRRPRSTTSRSRSPRARRPCATSARVTIAVDRAGRRCASSSTTGSLAATASASTSSRPTGAEHGDDHDRLGRRPRPDARSGAGRRRVRRGRHRAGPTVEVVGRRATPPTAVAAAGDTPVSFVLTRLRTRPTDRWRSDPEPTMVRDFELPADAHVRRPPITVRLDQRATDAVLAELLGITGPQADRPGSPARRRPPAGRSPTATRRRRGPRRSAVPSARRSTSRRRHRATRSRITQPGGDHSPITGLRLTVGRHRRRCRRAATRRRRDERRDAARARCRPGPCS